MSYGNSNDGPLLDRNAVIALVLVVIVAVFAAYPKYRVLAAHP